LFGLAPEAVVDAQKKPYLNFATRDHGTLVWCADFLAFAVAIALDLSHYRGLTVLLLLSTVLFKSGGFYRMRLHLAVLDEAPGLAWRLLAACGIIATVSSFRHDHQATESLMRSAIIASALVLVLRMVLYVGINWARRRRLISHRTLLLGGGHTAGFLAEAIQTHNEYGLRLVGFLDHAREEEMGRLPMLGGVPDLIQVLDSFHASVLLIADGRFSDADLLTVVRTTRMRHLTTLIVPRMHEIPTGSSIADHISGIRVLPLSPPRLDGPATVVKRCFDVVVSGLFLLLTAPILAVTAVAVRLETGPGVLFRQPRIKQGGREFQLLKFRSLKPASESESATTWNIQHDSRMGPVGKLIRRCSIDELPQLLNILRGDMSLVGPRPERPHFVNMFRDKHEAYDYRHRAPVGLTGLAQVNGLRGDTSIADRARFDNYYIENWSLWLDLKIILRTLKEVVLARGG
jgi:exopolysaccharide biosynthesis polyprenyl glycosylphosphotransferase